MAGLDDGNAADLERGADRGRRVSLPLLSAKTRRHAEKVAVSEQVRRK
jgi:hypothetical protein